MNELIKKFGWRSLYRVLLVSAIQQHESDRCRRLCPHSWFTSHPTRSSQSPELRSMCSPQLPTSSLFYTRWCIYVSAAFLIHPTLSFPRWVHVCSQCLHLYSWPANRLTRHCVFVEWWFHYFPMKWDIVNKCKKKTTCKLVFFSSLAEALVVKV